MVNNNTLRYSRREIAVTRHRLYAHYRPHQRLFEIECITSHNFRGYLNWCLCSSGSGVIGWTGYQRWQLWLYCDCHDNAQNWRTDIGYPDDQ